MTAAANGWSVFCDEPGCLTEPIQGDDRVQALEAAYASGWVAGRRAGRHLCRLHDPRSLINNRDWTDTRDLGAMPAPGDYSEEGVVPTAVQNAWNEASRG